VETGNNMLLLQIKRIDHPVEPPPTPSSVASVAYQFCPALSPRGGATCITVHGMEEVVVQGWIIWCGAVGGGGSRARRCKEGGGCWVRCFFAKLEEAFPEETRQS
jgi:hypothetical protein